MPSICHITTAHSRTDVRIFLKELSSLSGSYECHFIVADGLNEENIGDVTIWDVGKGKGRLGRAIHVVRLAYKKALTLDCDLYHFHDPEFIFAALLLTWRGKKVVYDIHEDVPRDILSKEYLGVFRKPVSFIFELVENFCARRFTYLLAATPSIRDRFQKINKNTIDINNYPLTSEYFGGLNLDFENRTSVAYVGAISRIRGLVELVNAMDEGSVKLELAGGFDSKNFETELKSEQGWGKVNFHGLVSRKEVREILQKSFAGIVTFYPEPNHVNAQPNKIFEYMSAGIPVICSNFDAWREIVDKNQCGLLVNPMNSHEIANAIKYLNDNPTLAKGMGLNGMKAVKDRYNWDIEKDKLLDVYKKLLV
jgi:glycosyltransferase involved in cell wall biosynthesis